MRSFTKLQATESFISEANIYCRESKVYLYLMLCGEVKSNWFGKTAVIKYWHRIEF